MNGKNTAEYVVKIGESAADGQRQVQVFERKLDPREDVPVGQPVIIEPDEEAALAISHQEQITVETEADAEQVDPHLDRF